MAPLDSLVNISLYTAQVTSCKVQQSGTACMAPLDGVVVQLHSGTGGMAPLDTPGKTTGFSYSWSQNS